MTEFNSLKDDKQTWREIKTTNPVEAKVIEHSEDGAAKYIVVVKSFGAFEVTEETFNKLEIKE